MLCDFFRHRHLVIAVNPSHIEMYESLLFSAPHRERGRNYDFVKWAPQSDYARP